MLSMPTELILRCCAHSDGSAFLHCWKTYKNYVAVQFDSQGPFVFTSECVIFFQFDKHRRKDRKKEMRKRLSTLNSRVICIFRLPIRFILAPGQGGPFLDSPNWDWVQLLPILSAIIIFCFNWYRYSKRREATSASSFLSVGLWKI